MFHEETTVSILEVGEFRLLAHMIKTPGKVFSRFDVAWGEYQFFMSLSPEAREAYDQNWSETSLPSQLTGD